MTPKEKYNKTIRIWLIIGLIMLVGQVILGGITRLTGSGLSITRWDIVSGIIPPLNIEQWNDAFDLYKQTPQFHKINAHFELRDFKFIYFWEYFHRLWARILGFIFLIPFLIFLFQKKINFYLIKRLGLVIFFTALTASAGWIMVKSGLVDKPWVNAYKLTLHFILAILSIWAMVKTIADVYNYKIKNFVKSRTRAISFLILITSIQMIFAGLMAGMKAGIYFPTWPSMNGKFIPKILLESENWTLHNLTNYDTFIFSAALVQFTHRILAYLLVIMMFYVFVKYRSQVSNLGKKWIRISLVLILFQVLLGVLIVLNVGAGIPLFYGVAHQLVGVLYFISILFLYFSLRKKPSIKKRISN
ncbi:MAG: COX15/CtaA family protein [Flavobacteriaceae bacterium]|nr:COX15/CtaA family protein [Flavobacteriaceae bacterium]